MALRPARKPVMRWPKSSASSPRIPQPPGCDHFVRGARPRGHPARVDKFLMQLEEQLHEKKVDITFTPALKDYLARKGFDPLMGARPMARLIQDTIRSALADELLFGRLAAAAR